MMNIVNVIKRIVPFLLVATSCSGWSQSLAGKDVGLHPEARLPVDHLRLLTGRAALIFKGVVSGVEYETNAETGLPFTYITFRQIDPIKDRSGEFTSGKKKKLRIRLFGGLKENGTMTIVSHIPDFMLGRVYLIFYTGGEWDVSPIVGGELGVFQILKSRTLGYEMVLDYYGNVVVGVEGESLKILPLRPEPNTQKMSNTGTQETKISAKQTNEVEIDRDSIYTEENVKGMLADQEIAEIESEKDSTVARKDSIRVQMLKTLSSPPMSLEAFIDSILEIDKRHASDFHKYYSEVRLEGNPIRKERKPYQLIKREEATDQ